MRINTDYLNRCICELEFAYTHLPTAAAAEYGVYRAACVKEFEIILEQGGALLKKRLGDFFADNKAADFFSFKDVFRHAAKRGLVTVDECERWLHYRDSRNSAAHNDGENFAENTMKLLPDFIADAKALSVVLRAGGDG